MNNEKVIEKIMKLKYGKYTCHVDNCISYRRLGNTRRLKFSKLYTKLQEFGVTATFQEAKHIVFKYRANSSRVNVHN